MSRFRDRVDRPLPGCTGRPVSRPKPLKPTTSLLRTPQASDRGPARHPSETARHLTTREQTPCKLRPTRDRKNADGNQRATLRHMGTASSETPRLSRVSRVLGPQRTYRSRREMRGGCWHAGHCLGKLLSLSIQQAVILGIGDYWGYGLVGSCIRMGQAAGCRGCERRYGAGLDSSYVTASAARHARWRPYALCEGASTSACRNGGNRTHTVRGALRRLKLRPGLTARHTVAVARLFGRERDAMACRGDRRG